MEETLHVAEVDVRVGDRELCVGDLAHELREVVDAVVEAVVVPGHVCAQRVVDLLQAGAMLSELIILDLAVRLGHINDESDRHKQRVAQLRTRAAQQRRGLGDERRVLLRRVRRGLCSGGCCSGTGEREPTATCRASARCGVPHVERDT